MTEINGLPQDILEVIFEIHVLSHRESRTALLLTCRLWHATMINHRNMWKSIALGSKVPAPPETIVCSDLESLAVIVNRTGATPFDLYLGEPLLEPSLVEVESFISAVDKKWLSRCRSLFMLPQKRHSFDPNRLGLFFRSCSLHALEVLEIRYRANHCTWEPVLRSVMQGINGTASSFHTLRIRVMGLVDDTSWMTQTIFAFPAILSRVSFLYLRHPCEPIPWNYFTNIHEIELWSNSELTPQVNYDLPPVKHLTFGGVDELGAKPQSVWHHLTHLTFKDTLDEDLMSVLHLPSLVSLSLIVCSIDLQLFDAPKVQDLTVRLDPLRETSSAYPLFEDANFAPRLARIDIQNSDDPENVLMDITIPLPIWQQVEDLQLRVLSDAPFLPPVLFEALNDNSPDRCFPKLHSLSVFYLLREGNKWEDAELINEMREEEKDEMRKLMESRIESGKVAGFKRLELGWYLEYGDDYVDPEWRVVEWADCLCSKPTL